MVQQVVPPPCLPPAPVLSVCASVSTETVAVKQDPHAVDHTGRKVLGQINGGVKQLQVAAKVPLMDKRAAG